MSKAIRYGYKPATEEEKVALYDAGRCGFKPPPVCSARWDKAAWIRHVDGCGGWMFPDPVAEAAHAAYLASARAVYKVPPWTDPKFAAYVAKSTFLPDISIRNSIGLSGPGIFFAGNECVAPITESGGYVIFTVAEVEVTHDFETLARALYEYTEGPIDADA